MDYLVCGRSKSRNMNARENEMCSGEKSNHESLEVRLTCDDI